MRRSASTPSFPITPATHPPAVLSILNLAYNSALQSPSQSHSQHTPPIAASTWSPLIRWVENPMRLQSLAVYTLAANAGLHDAEWRGVSMSVLRRSGEWHNLISYPHIRPAVSYVKQIISIEEMQLAQQYAPRARGIEWFLLAQLSGMSNAPYARQDELVILAPSQISLSMLVTPPQICHSDLHDPLPLRISEAIFPSEHIPPEGNPWGITNIAFHTPMLEVSNPESIMQLLVRDDPSIGAHSALIGLSARRVVDNYVESVRLGVLHGMAVSLHTLHVNDIALLLVNEAKATVPPDSNDWFIGIDHSILHFCRDELYAWVSEHHRQNNQHLSRLIEILRLAQSKYLQATEGKFEEAGVPEGMAVACFEDKIRLCAQFSFFRLVQRVRRGDSLRSLLHILENIEPRCYTDILAVVKLEDSAFDVVRPDENEAESFSVSEIIVSSSRIEENVSDLRTSWMSKTTAKSVTDIQNEIIRSEPRSAHHEISPDPHYKVSHMDLGMDSILSNRPDKIVWRENRSGGYWRCLLPWILLTDVNYKILPSPSGIGIIVREVSATHRPGRHVTSFKELHDEIETRLKEDLITVSRSNLTLPDSWLDPEVRTSLILLIAGGRGLLHLGVFSPCLQNLISILKELLFKQQDKTLEKLIESIKGTEVRRRVRRTQTVRYDSSLEKFGRIPLAFLPAEVHACEMSSPPKVINKKGWIGIRWHEDTVLVATGFRENNTLHAHNPYLLLNSNTFELRTHSATNFGSYNSWIIGCLNVRTLLRKEGKEVNRVPRMETPHIAMEAHSLEMLYWAAERALQVKIGVLWSISGGVVPAVVLKGPIGFLRQLVSWIPSLSVLGTGFKSPPALQDRKERLYFSRGRFAALVWNQDQLRDILSRKILRLKQELGLVGVPGTSLEANSTYIAHAVADMVILYLHAKKNLPVVTSEKAGWPLPTANSDDGGLRVMQKLMLPKTVAVHAGGNNELEMAVDNENKLVFKECHLEHKQYKPNGMDEYKLFPSGGSSFERITTGTVADSAFSKLEKRVLIGSLS